MRIPRGNVSPAGRLVAKLLIPAAAIGAAAPVCSAEYAFGAAIGAQYDSNAFQLAAIEGQPLVEGVPDDRDDIARTITADGSMTVGGQGPLRLQFNASFSRYESGTSARLDRNDYTFGSTLVWRLSQAMDLNITAYQNRLPLGLADVGGDEAAQTETTQATATLNIRPTPRWQVALAPGWHKDRTALVDAPDFALEEKIGSASISYLGAGSVVPGLSVKGTRGEYEGIANATRYRQRTIEGTLKYEATGLSSFNFALGHTQRSTRLVVPSNDPMAIALEDDDSALTGMVSYHRVLSVKTTFDISAFRYFEQYDAGVNTTVGTGLNASVNWAPTAKLGVNLSTTVIHADIMNVTQGTAGGERRDLLRGHTFSLSYQATRIVGLRTYVTRSIRRSEVWLDQYNSTQVGLEMTARID